MRLALAIGSFVILIVHGLVFYKQFFHKWENYQTAYFDQARALAKTPAEKAALADRSPRIEQQIVTQFGDARVDRCTTCHVASDDPRFGEHAQPLRTHPFTADLGDKLANGRWERRHKFTDFGCTVCHDGQGRGLKEEYAHGNDEYWTEPLLGYVVQQHWRKEFQQYLKGKEYMQAACVQCHTEENFAATPMVARGRKLFFAQNCYGCHRIEGLSDGTLGPELTEAGKKFRVDYLWESIVDPRANMATSIMPNFHLKPDDVKALVIFLKSRRGMNFNETGLEKYEAALNAKKPTEAATAPAELTGAAQIARGKEVIEQRSCGACHKVLDKDGGIAPDLTYEGLQRDSEWVYQHFKDPKSMTPDSIMPTFRLPDSDLRAMTAYLMSSKPAPAAMSEADTFKTLCQRCHGEKGDGHGPIAWYLDPYPRDLTKSGFINSKPLDRLVTSVKKGVAGTSMPAWENVLKEEQIKSLLDFVFKTYTKEPRKEVKAQAAPDSNPVASTAESITRGEQTFVNRCSGCHGRKADGKGPNSLDILPRPRNLRNSAFVASVTDHRLFESIMYGVQGTAMPSWIDYGLSKEDVGDLVNFIRSINAKTPARTLNARRY